jgi:dTDP-4-amino-4,6-dideoxygalactose transaminase
MKINFLDLNSQYLSIRDEIGTAIQAVLDSSAFASGPFVEEFETAFASFCDCEYAIGVGSGTEAIWLSLAALGVGPGDEVITVPNTFIATVEAISMCGAEPVFVDIDEITYNMDVHKIEGAITRKTKAIVPVHLFGHPVDMDPVMEIASAYDLPVVEDACQAHGATYKKHPAGSIGTVGCFSFYPGKNLGAYGDAGAVVTNNPAIANTIKSLRDHGQSKKYYHDTIGWNARMDGLQGAILNVKLRHLAGWNLNRRANAQHYNKRLQGLKNITTPHEANYATHVYHVYVIRAPSRDLLIQGLSEMNIYCGIHYPVPIHLQAAYRFLGLKPGSFPVAEKYAKEIISLPMFAELTEPQIELVVKGIETVLT